MNDLRDVDHFRSEGAFSPVAASPLAGLDVLRESEARFRASFELAPVGLAHVGIGGEWLAVNARLCELLGYTRDELLATSFQALTHPGDLAEDLHQAHRLVAGEVESYSMPKRYLRKDGAVVWARLTRSLVRDAGGVPFHFLSVVDEIAGPELERVRAEGDEAERLAAALVAVHDGAYDWNVSTGDVHFSAQWCRMLGYAPEEIASHYTSWEVRVHPDDLPGALATLQAHLDARSAAYESEHRMQRKDGSWAWVLSRGEVVARDSEGRPLRMVGTHRDITAGREAGAALAQSEAVARRQVAELEAVYGSAPVGLAFLGADLRYLRVNDRLARLNGVSPADHVGRTPAEITPALAPFLEPLLRSVLATGEPVRGLEFRTEAPGEPGVLRDWLLDFQPAVDAAGAIVGVTCAVAEITALKRAEAAARAALRREEEAHAVAETARARAEEAARAKSAFLATMSHEFRTPLNAIAGHVQLIEMGIHGSVTAAQSDALERVALAQRHLLRLVNDVLDLARLEAHGVSYRFEAVSLAEVVAELDPLVGPQACAKGITFSIDVDPACVVRGDRDKLVQILVNLVSNAVKFTDAGGTVTVECATRAAGDDDPGVVHLRVRDTGIGIPADRLEYIFDPYAQIDTTPAGRAAGTGLGLAISRNLARGMGGDVRARSTPGVGSAFTVTLPRADA